MSNSTIDDSSLALARQAFEQGTAYFDAGQLDDAHASFEQALMHAPERPSILLNLGVTKVHLRRFEQALPLLQAALVADPNALDGLTALALCQSELCQWHEASNTCERAIDLGAAPVSMYLLQAKCLARQGSNTAALQAYEQCLQLAPDHAQAWYELGDLQREVSLTDQAEKSYRNAMRFGANAQLVEYMLSALRKAPPVLDPPRMYVQALFDQYANDFDQHLVGQLGYCGHSQLIEKLPTANNKTFYNTLDLGCGTGLSAPLLRPLTQYLCGVDLSPAMIEKARFRQLYDELTTADLHEYLDTQTRVFDLVVATDVFIYVGQLNRLFAQLALRIKSGGILAFTLEPAANGAGVQLLPSLRYAHAPDYINDLAAQQGFSVLAMHEAPIRVEKGEPLMGQYWYLQR